MPRPKKETVAQGLIREAAKLKRAELARRQARQEFKVKETLSEQRDKIRDLEQMVEELSDFREVLEAVQAHPAKPHKIVRRQKRPGLFEATALLMLSDLHMEERVVPEEINGLNEFNLKIASERMDRLAVGTIWMLELARSQYQIKDIILACLGDNITGNLRMEDLSNFLSPNEAIIFVAEELTRCFKRISDACPWLEHLYVPVVPGNHDRLSFSKATPFRDRVKQSNVVLLAYMLQQNFRDDKRVKIELSASEHHYTHVYDHTIRSMHGDRFSYQGGIGGIFIPARKHILGLNKAIHAHLTLFGHWHQAKQDDLWASNGSLIGANTYSIGKGLDPEPPAQVFMILDKLRGKRLCTPIQVGDKEEWS